jgi:cysteine-rich repeat protein
MLVGDKKRKLKILTVAIIILIVGLFVVVPALAQVDAGLENAQGVGLGQNSVKTIIVRSVQILLGFLGILAVIVILYGGFIWMTAGGDAGKIDKAKKVLMAAVIGLIIILSSYAITAFIFTRIGWATGFMGLDPVGGGTTPIGDGTLSSNRFAQIYEFKVDDLEGDGISWNQEVSGQFRGTVAVPIIADLKVGGNIRNRDSSIDRADLYMAADDTVDFNLVSGFDSVPTSQPIVSGVYATWDTAAYDIGAIKRIKLVADVPDTDINTSDINSRERKTRLLPIHCFNEVLDGGETEVDCGGGCGACGGDACSSDESQEACIPNDELCRRGVCLTDSCTCARNPEITDISPDNGASGNYITITGRYFGDEVGRILVYTGPETFVIADLPPVGSCDDTWSDRQIIFEVPSGLAVSDYEIKVETHIDIGALLSDEEDFDINTIVRPGICNVVNATEPSKKDSGVYPDEVNISGTNFGATTGNVIWGFTGGVTSTPGTSGSWSNELVNDIIPENKRGHTNIKIYNSNEYSNPAYFLASRGQVGDPCGYPDDEVCANPDACVEGLVCSANNCTCQNPPNTDSDDDPTGDDDPSGLLVIKPAASSIYTWEFTSTQFLTFDICGNNRLDINEGEECDEVDGIDQYRVANSDTCSFHVPGGVGTVSCLSCQVDSSDCAIDDRGSLLIKPAASAIYTWDFRVYGTGDLTDPYADFTNPYVIENCSRDLSCLVADPPSPSPWQDWAGAYQGAGAEKACLNTKIGARFNNSMNTALIESKVELYICGAASESSACTKVGGTFEFYSDDKGFNIVPGQNLTEGSWYKVAIRDGVKNKFGFDLIKNNNRQCNIDGISDIDYCWSFKTRSSADEAPLLCEIGCLNCNPKEKTLRYINNAVFYGSDFASEDNACLVLKNPPGSYTWSTSESTKVSLADVFDEDDPAEIVSDRKIGVAVGETINDTPDHAVITVAYQERSGVCKTTVDLTNPVVISSRSCDNNTIQSPSPFVGSLNACTNAVVSARFNLPMVNTTITGNVQVYECSGGEGIGCTDISGDINVFEYSHEIAYDNLSLAGDLDQEKDLPEGFAISDLGLQSNTWYKVVIKGGTDGVKAAKRNEDGTYDEGTPRGILIGSGDAGTGDYTWNFKTANEICEVDTVGVSPAQKLALVGGVEQEFKATPKAANCNWIDDTNCNFDWDWQSKRANGQSATHIADLFGGVYNYGCGASWDENDSEPNKADKQIYVSDEEGIAYIWAKVSGISGSGQYNVGLANLNITDKSPDCDISRNDPFIVSEEICINAQLQVDFSIDVEGDSLNINTVKLYAVDDEDQLIADAIPSVTVIIDGCVGYGCVTDQLRFGVISNSEDNLYGDLEGNQMYRVVIFGGEDGIISETKKQLNIATLNYNSDTGSADGNLDSYSWVFKTKDTDSQCVPDNVKINPSSQSVRGANTVTSPYEATPYSVGDACRSDGQMLKGNEYRWDWSIEIDGLYNEEKFIFVNPIIRGDAVPFNPRSWRAWAKVNHDATETDIADIEATILDTAVTCSEGNCATLTTECPNNYNDNVDGVCTISGQALDVYGCCVNRPDVIDPNWGTVCSNAVLEISFNRLMDRDSIRDNILVVLDTAYINTEGDSWWSKTKRFFKNIFTFTGSTVVVAETGIGFEYSVASVGGKTVVSIWPQNQSMWTTGSQYNVTVKGDSVDTDDIRRGVLSKNGTTMSGDRSFSFDTSSEICLADRIEVDVHIGEDPLEHDYDPVYYNQDSFFCFERDSCGDATINDYTDDDTHGSTDGNQHVYKARTYSGDQKITAYYNWEITGIPTDGILSVNSMSDTILWGEGTWSRTLNSGMGQYIVVSAFRDQGTETGTANIKVTATSVSSDEVDGSAVNSVSRTVPVKIISCNNPWPDASDFPYQDSNSNCGSGTGDCINTNFETYYCRDNDGGDLLPKIGKYDSETGLLNVPVLGNSDASDDVIKDFLLFQDDITDFATDDVNVIGLRVMNNNSHLAPITWYQEHFDPGSQGNPQLIEVDTYEAVREGRTIYVNAADLGDNGIKIFNKVYVASYNDGASREIIGIFNQIIDNFKLNTGTDDGALNDFGRCGKYTRDPNVLALDLNGSRCLVDSDCSGDNYCLSDKAKLARETRRLSDIQYINYLLSDEDGGYYNQRRCSNDPNILCNDASVEQTLFGDECIGCVDVPNDTVISFGFDDDRSYVINAPYQGDYLLTLYTSNHADVAPGNCFGGIVDEDHATHHINVNVGGAVVGSVDPLAVNNSIQESNIVLRDIDIGNNDVLLDWTNDCCDIDCDSNLKIYGLKLTEVDNSVCYGNGVCGNYNPELQAGTYVTGRTSSVWPSWQSTLGNALGSALPLDPINKIYGCDEIPGADNTTCWDAKKRIMYCNDINPYYYSYNFNIGNTTGHFIGRRAVYARPEVIDANWHDNPGDSRGAWTDLRYFRYNDNPNPLSGFGPYLMCGSGTCGNGIPEEGENCISCSSDKPCDVSGNTGKVCVDKASYGGAAKCECRDLDSDGYPDIECPSSTNPIDNCAPPDSIVIDSFGKIINESQIQTDWYNPDQLDNDGDGVGDKCDNCLNVPNPAQLPVGEPCVPTYGNNCSYYVYATPADAAIRRCSVEIEPMTEFCGNGQPNEGELGDEDCDDTTILSAADYDTYFSGDIHNYNVSADNDDGGCVYSPEGARDFKRCKYNSCGDGYLDAGSEACDDGNNNTEDCARGDEECLVCNSVCERVNGNVSYCGDGMVNGSTGVEVCDNGKQCENGDVCSVDSNCSIGSCSARDGDGCNATCTIEEPGYDCNPSTGICTSVCGDSEVAVGVELCDDGRHCADGTPCSSYGGACASDGSICEPRNFGTCNSSCGGNTYCGDGVRNGTEECDLGAAFNDDGINGCTNICECDITNGWECSTGTPQPVCGDNIVVDGREGCDEGDWNREWCDYNPTVNNDTDARAQCAVTDLLYTATKSYPGANLCDSSSCTFVSASVHYCGDGQIDIGNSPLLDENCDDGNHNSSDGCSDSCQTEPGWDCLTPGSACVPICNDGIIVGSEGAPSGIGNNISKLVSTNDGKGCDFSVDGSVVRNRSECVYNSDARVGGGNICWLCRLPGGPNECTVQDMPANFCGDGNVDVNNPPADDEECDDGNKTNSDGCNTYNLNDESLDCKFVCGDGHLRPTFAEEQCDYNINLGNLYQGDKDDCTDFDDNTGRGRNFIAGSLGCNVDTNGNSCMVDTSACISGFNLDIQILSAFDYVDNDPGNGLPPVQSKVRLYKGNAKIEEAVADAEGIVSFDNVYGGDDYVVVVDNKITTVDGFTGVCRDKTFGYPTCPQYLINDTGCLPSSSWPSCKHNGTSINPLSFIGKVRDDLVVNRDFEFLGVDASPRDGKDDGDALTIYVVPYILDVNSFIILEWRNLAGGTSQNLDANLAFYPDNVVSQSNPSVGSVSLDIDASGESGTEVISVKSFAYEGGNPIDYYYYVQNRKKNWTEGSVTISVFDNVSEFNNIATYTLEKCASGGDLCFGPGDGTSSTINVSAQSQLDYWEVFTLRYNPAALGSMQVNAVSQSNSSFTDGIIPMYYETHLPGPGYYPRRLEEIYDSNNWPSTTFTP